ncbi:MAG: SsrA-binding protein SmpB [Micrococcaceae bacterium]
MPREKGKKIIASNRRARHDYHILDTYEAGISLYGTEVKSLRHGKASLTDGYAQVDNGEAWLENIYIPEYLNGSWTNHEARRKRKLLLHKEEIRKLAHKTRETGLTIVPLELYFRNGRAKVAIGIAKGKKEYDKRHALREKQDKREAQRAMSVKNRQYY